MDVEDLKKEIGTLFDGASKTMEDARVQLSNSMQDAREHFSNSVQDARDQFSNSMEDARLVVEQKKEEMQNLILEGQQQIQEKIEQLEAMAYEIDWFVAVPLIISFAAIWSIFMFRTRNTDENFASSLHAVLVVILAFGNMFWGFDERFMFALMTGYFISDLIHFCLIPEYFIYIFHHILTVVAVHYMVTSSHYAVHFMASKAVMVEISTPFLNTYRTTNKAIHGVLFAISFLAVRVIWLGYISTHGYVVSKYPFEVLIIVLFAGLNMYWFFEIAKGAYGMMASKPTPKEISAAATPVKELLEKEEQEKLTSAKPVTATEISASE